MKTQLFYISISLGIFTHLNAATIRVYNKTKSQLTVTVYTKNPITFTIPPMRSEFANSWFNTIRGFEWQSDGKKWQAPLSMRSLQTEGRLYIKNDGQYIFKPCLPCKQSRGMANLIEKSAAPEPLSKKQIKKRKHAKKMRQQIQELEAENMAAEESFGG